jgi:hypothetical protein
METTDNSIEYPLIQNYIRVIRSLAQRGRSAYEQYFVNPLQKWAISSRPLSPREFTRNVDDIPPEERSPYYQRAITGSLQKDPAQAGSIAIRFLREMKLYESIRSSTEARDFVSILKDPFREYAEKEFQRMDRRFTEAMEKVNLKEAENLARQRNKGTFPNRDEAWRQAARERSLLRGISDSEDLKNGIIAYLIRFSVPMLAAEGNLADYLFDDLGIDNTAIRGDLMKTTAVIIYHEVLRSIREGDLGKAVRFIGKYAILFRGNPETPYFQEMDTFEKKFLQLVEEKNLWNQIDT